MREIYQKRASILCLFGWALWTLYAHLFQRQPPVGTYVAILGFTVVIVTIWPADRTWSKATWLIVFFALTVSEINNLYRDRAEHDQQQADASAKHDREQKEARDQQLQSFQKIANGLETAIHNSEKQFRATMRKEAQNLNTITGGDSFCYMDFPSGFTSDSGGIPIFIHRGQYPLSGVSAQIYDLVKSDTLLIGKPTLTLEDISKVTFTIFVGNLAPHSSTSLHPEWRLPFSGVNEQRFNISFSSDRNGFWSETVQLRRLDNNWFRALRVMRQKGKMMVDIMPPVIDSNYPRGSTGKVDWH